MSSTREHTGVFGYVGRRLALLNAAVVVLLITTVGIGIVIFARYTLLDQADQLLLDQAEIARLDWGPSLSAGDPLPIQPSPVESDENEDDEEEHDDNDELIESGDVIALGFDAEGALVANDRGLKSDGLPEQAAVNRALSGEDGFQTKTVEDGHEVRIYTAPILAEGQIVGAVQVIRSTEQVNNAIRAIELAALIGALIGALCAIPAGLFLARRAMQPIDHAFRKQQQFIADASHELRTPLAVIRANTEMVRRMPNAPVGERDADLAVTLNEVDRMADMIDQLLILARADAGQLAPATDIVDVALIVRDAVKPMTQLALESGVQLLVDTPESVLATGDEARLAQVVRILVGNAIAYTPNGGSVHVTVETPNDSVQIQVKDTGIGMSDEELRRIFDRFYRGDKSRTRSKGGVGLGLSIAQEVVRSHGGSLEFESKPGSGTTATVRLLRVSVSDNRSDS